MKKDQYKTQTNLLINNLGILPIIINGKSKIINVGFHKIKSIKTSRNYKIFEANDIYRNNIKWVRWK